MEQALEPTSANPLKQAWEQWWEVTLKLSRILLDFEPEYDADEEDAALDAEDMTIDIAKEMLKGFPDQFSNDVNQLRKMFQKRRREIRKRWRMRSPAVVPPDLVDDEAEEF